MPSIFAQFLLTFSILLTISVTPTSKLNEYLLFSQYEGLSLSPLSLYPFPTSILVPREFVKAPELF